MGTETQLPFDKMVFRTYNGMLLSVNHRFSRNFTLLANYSFSHCISDGNFNGELTNTRQSQTPDPLAGERGNCGFDRRHVFNNPDLSRSSSQFGQIRGANDPRILQLAVKYRF